jgi:hypothetical protein
LLILVYELFDFESGKISNNTDKIWIDRKHTTKKVMEIVEKKFKNNNGLEFRKAFFNFENINGLGYPSYMFRYEKKHKYKQPDITTHVHEPSIYDRFGRDTAVDIEYTHGIGMNCIYCGCRPNNCQCPQGIFMRR